MTPVSLLWLIPVLPLLGAFVNGVFGWKWEHGNRKVISFVALCSTALSLLLALWNIFWLMGLSWESLPALPSNVTVDAAHHSVSLHLAQWIPGGDFVSGGGAPSTFLVEWLFVLDPLSCAMLFVVAFVGFLIHVYSVGYMAHDAGYFRYFSYLNLFMAMMLTLVLGGNYLVMFIGWEGVGLCSYLLIGFYYQKDYCADAGKKAFLTNRIGDMGFAAGLMLILYWFGTLDIAKVNEIAVGGSIPGWVVTASAILLFVGATGKSAQIPLYVWLPDAMAGPTPVSALIHAATMVTSGVYLVARSNGLYSMSPTALMVVAGVGCATAVFAATIGLVQNDVKKVLAYSTVSQLGYMFLGVGVGAYAAGIFHLYTHAFFKALLFLGSGSVIHALSGEQDIRKMGQLWGRIPSTARTFLIGCLAIAGIPGLAGFFSKDEILWMALDSGNGPGHFPPVFAKVLWGVGVAAAMMTAFYMFRLLYLTFFNSDRVSHEAAHHLHESPKVMTVPLWILAIGSIVAGYVGLPKLWVGEHGNLWENWLHPTLYAPAVHGAAGAEGAAAHAAHHSASLEWWAMVASVVVALIGIGLASLWYRREKDTPSRLARALSFPYKVVLNKYFVDEIYFGALIRPFVMMSRIASGVDQWLVDGTVNVVAYANEVLGMLLRFFQTGYIRNYALFILLGILVLLYFFS
jgi:NADH-quinone oxidoreductase subunit L